MKSFFILLICISFLSLTPIKPTNKKALFKISSSATCIGAKYCKACKNCKYCKHCAKKSGTCGVCK